MMRAATKRSRELLWANRVVIDAPGGRRLITDFDLSMGHERAALVGRNGVGKSSLLDVLAGHSAPRSGEVRCVGTRHLVSQQLGVGLFVGKSAGERRRAALQHAFELRPNLLLLDEPTQDLDESSAAWLLDSLGSWRGGLIVVSHDRRLLRTFDQYLIVAESGCRHFEGSFEALQTALAAEANRANENYATRLLLLAQKEEHNDAVRRRRERKKNVGRIRELARCPARAQLNGKRGYAQESQGTRAVLQKERISAARDGAKAARRALEVQLPLRLHVPTPGSPSPTPCVTLERASVTGEGRTLFEDLTREFGADRVGIVGANGSGKTTLLSIIVGHRVPTRGSAQCQPGRIGYIAQHGSNWCGGDSLLETLRLETETPAESLPALLAAHAFPLALAERPMASLSPGERTRAALIALFQRKPTPELLVLDEPTAQLDLVGLGALEGALRCWPGGLVVVSHDREFLHNIGIDEQIELRPVPQ